MGKCLFRLFNHHPGGPSDRHAAGKMCSSISFRKALLHRCLEQFCLYTFKIILNLMCVLGVKVETSPKHLVMC